VNRPFAHVTSFGSGISANVYDNRPPCVRAVCLQEVSVLVEITGESPGANMQVSVGTPGSWG
jgi:hypothetical protein